jgi:predicted nucleic acid-binding protein
VAAKFNDMVSIDCNFLSLLLYPGAKAPDDPATGKPIERLADRMENLISELDESDERIIVPMPVLAEFLILAGKDGQEYLEKIVNTKTFLLKPFDEKAAIELAAREIADRAKGDKRGGVKDDWQKIKIDRQIVAIAKVNGAHTIYADDRGLRTFAKKLDMKVVGSWELYLPPSSTPLFDGLPELAEGEDPPKPNEEEKKNLLLTAGRMFREEDE